MARPMPPPTGWSTTRGRASSGEPSYVTCTRVDAQSIAHADVHASFAGDYHAGLCQHEAEKNVKGGWGMGEEGMGGSGMLPVATAFSVAAGSSSLVAASLGGSQSGCAL